MKRDVHWCVVDKMHCTKLLISFCEKNMNCVVITCEMFSVRK